MAATAEHIAATTGTAPPDDQYVLLRDADWADYERLLTLRDESAVPRLTFLDGSLELMTPSTGHETHKKTLARLIETWALEMDIPLEGYGSWTIKSRQAKRGAEPGECCLLGPIAREPTVPDVAIEVVRTSGGIDKLEVYRALGVPEVWFWRRGRLSFYVLEDGAYQSVPRSRALPQLDPTPIETCMTASSQTEAV